MEWNSCNSTPLMANCTDWQCTKPRHNHWSNFDKRIKVYVFYKFSMLIDSSFKKDAMVVTRTDVLKFRATLCKKHYPAKARTSDCSYWFCASRNGFRHRSSPGYPEHEFLCPLNLSCFFSPLICGWKIWIRRTSCGVSIIFLLKKGFGTLLGSGDIDIIHCTVDMSLKHMVYFVRLWRIALFHLTFSTMFTVTRNTCYFFTVNTNQKV